MAHWTADLDTENVDSECRQGGKLQKGILNEYL